MWHRRREGTAQREGTSITQDGVSLFYGHVRVHGPAFCFKLVLDGAEDLSRLLDGFRLSLRRRE